MLNLNNGFSNKPKHMQLINIFLSPLYSVPFSSDAALFPAQYADVSPKFHRFTEFTH